LLNEIDDPEVKMAAVLRFEPAAVRMRVPDPEQKFPVPSN
jgi:hypothetical protein